MSKVTDISTLKKKTEERDYTRAEVEKIIEEGKAITNELLEQLPQMLINLANTNHQLGRYQELLNHLPEDEPPKELA